MKPALLLTVLIGWAIPVFAQPDSANATAYQVNFAVPDQPGFKGLGVEASRLLRPSLAQPFSFVSSEFGRGKQLTLPEAFGVEVAPWKMSHSNRITLQ